MPVPVPVPVPVFGGGGRDDEVAVKYCQMSCTSATDEDDGMAVERFTALAL